MAIIRFFWLKKKISGGRQVNASIQGLRTKKSIWKRRNSNYLKLSFDIDEKHFEKEVSVEFSSELSKMLEKGSTKILVKGSEAKKIILLELICDVDF